MSSGPAPRHERPEASHAEGHTLLGVTDGSRRRHPQTPRACDSVTGCSGKVSLAAGICSATQLTEAAPDPLTGWIARCLNEPSRDRSPGLHRLYLLHCAVRQTYVQTPSANVCVCGGCQHDLSSVAHLPGCAGPFTSDGEVITTSICLKFHCGQIILVFLI